MAKKIPSVVVYALRMVLPGYVVSLEAVQQCVSLICLFPISFSGSKSIRIGKDATSGQSSFSFMWSHCGWCGDGYGDASLSSVRLESPFGEGRGDGTLIVHDVGLSFVSNVSALPLLSLL